MVTRDRTKKEKLQYTSAIIALSSFVIGAMTSGIVVALIYATQVPQQLSALRQSNIAPNQTYQFIDPLIGLQGGVNSQSYTALQQQVTSYVDAQKNNGLIAASIDFRDIKKPGGFVINPTQLYTPASLYKVPLMMIYYKLSESDSSILAQELLYSGGQDRDATEEVRSEVQLVPGTRYTIGQLIEHMIRYSDNNAVALLIDHLQTTGHYQDYLSLFSSFGIDPSTLTNTAQDMITVQQYSLFMRSLYNATYLNRDDSERALQLLSTTDFTQGIESGIPNGILVAQKFGETTIADSNGDVKGKELGNCGIVYYPNHPYLLCIMLIGQGDNIQALEHILSSISHTIFENMQASYPSA